MFPFSAMFSAVAVRLPVPVIFEPEGREMPVELLKLYIRLALSTTAPEPIAPVVVPLPIWSVPALIVVVP